MLLGASNVTLGFGVLSRLVRAGFDGPLDVRAALGHGRSYGSWSTMGIRSLPGIINCGLWKSLADSEPAPTRALLTDVGNDLVYGSRPEMIAGWVETCLQRLAEQEARVVVTRLPLPRVERLTPVQYHAVRLGFFPFHPVIGWPDMLGRARELDARVTELADRYGAALITPSLDWYGLDPIHIRRKDRPAAWAKILGTWPGFQLSAGRLRQPSMHLLGHFAEHCRLCGLNRTTPQPVLRRNDATLALY